MSKSLFFFFLFAIGTVFSGQAQSSATVSPRDVKTNRVQKAKPTKGKADWLTALYLRPVEPTAPNRENWPLVPAQLLEGPPTVCIDTPHGPKSLSQLKKGDLLYRYEVASQRMSTWEVRIVQRKARRANAYDLARMEDGSDFPDNRVAWGH